MIGIILLCGGLGATVAVGPTPAAVGAMLVGLFILKLKDV